MSQREIANLCCRVLAVYALLQGFARIAYVASLLWPLFQTRASTTEAVFGAMMGASEPLLWLIAGGFLWRWSGLIAAWMVGTNLHDHRDEPDDQRRSASTEAVHLIAFSTVGLWVLVDAVPRMLGFFVHFAYARFHGHVVGTVDGGRWLESFIDDALRLAIGLYLLFGASGLLRIVRGTKNFGLEEREQPEFVTRGDSPGGSKAEQPRSERSAD